MEEQIPLFNDEQAFIKGEVIHIIFQNEENYYTVALVKIKETSEDFPDKKCTVVGTIPNVDVHDHYVFYGHVSTHPKFGLQFQVSHYERVVPETKQGIIQYLSSDRFPGIGKKTAEKIVSIIGDNALSKILDNPEILTNVPNLSKEKRDLIYNQLLEHQGIEQVIHVLSKYGIGVELSIKIFQFYKFETLEIIQTNPYQLIMDIEGIGFKKADLLGEAIGIVGNHPSRIQAGILYLLHDICTQEGHVFLYKEELIQECIRLLSTNEVLITNDEVEKQILILEEEQKIAVEEERVYLLSLYFAEKGIVSNIKRLLSETVKDEFPQSEFLKSLGEIEEQLKMEFAERQKEAIQTALSSPVMILTGGPGTGKTTVIKGIVELYSKLHGVSIDIHDYKKGDDFPIVLVAPTGRAAKRMGEATGLPAYTIHRLLGYKGGNGGFEKDEFDQITGELLIVDEVSMVDVWLANQLFKSVPTGMQVILVGDQDQLPSVGPGQVLKDLLDAKVIPTVELTDVYRQKEGSSIIELAHEIKRGEFQTDILMKTRDRRFFPCEQDQVLDVVEQICLNAIKKGYTAKDVQVLAPMYRGNAGIETLNAKLQELFNPRSEKKREIAFGDKVFRKGDVVLQLVNNPEEQVFNGDRGEIVAIIYAKENIEKTDKLVVSFDGIEVTYEKKDLNQLTHAYCTSIHKAQGSEFPIVVMPVVKGYYRMLRRNLIYTGITRAKQFLILCGSIEAFQLAISREDDLKRNTMLCEKLKAHLAEES